MSADADIAARRAVVVASTRTGSTWLSSLLDSHPEIRFHGELFNLAHAPVEAVLDPGAYLDRCLGDGGVHRVVGFKLLDHQARVEYLNDFLGEMDEGRPSDVDWRRLFPKRPVAENDAPAMAATWALLRRSGGRIVHLRRRNLLRREISQEIMMAESRTRWRGASPSGRPRVRLAAEGLAVAFASQIASSEEVDRFFAGGAKLNVFYEDLVRDLAVETARILDFLGVRIMPLGLDRPTPIDRGLRDAVDNYAEVEKALKGTLWERFLDEE